MTATQAAVVRQYNKNVGTIYAQCNALKALMDSKDFKALFDTPEDKCADDLAASMELICGDYNCFLRDLPCAVGGEE